MCCKAYLQWFICLFVFLTRTIALLWMEILFILWNDNENASRINYSGTLQIRGTVFLDYSQQGSILTYIFTQKSIRLPKTQPLLHTWVYDMKCLNTKHSAWVFAVMGKCFTWIKVEYCFNLRLSCKNFFTSGYNSELLFVIQEYDDRVFVSSPLIAHLGNL